MTSLYAPLFEKFFFRTTAVFSGIYCSDIHKLREHDSGFVHFIRSGNAELIMPSKPPIQVSEPSLVFFPRPHSHSIRAVDAAGINIFCARVLFNSVQTNPVALSFPDELVVPLRELPNTTPILRILFTEAEEQNLSHDTILNHLCVVLLVQMIRYLIECGGITYGALGGLSDRRIAAALTMIHTQYANAIVLDDLAQMSGMSRSRFAAHFKAVVGQTPFEYLAAYRIGVAQTLLLSVHPIRQITADVGYESASAFNRQFKSVTGISPREWRIQGVFSGYG